MAVNTYISDLFFNTDVSDAKEFERGEFVGYDDKKMIVEAATFISCLDEIVHGSVTVPTARELVDDFYARV